MVGLLPESVVCLIIWHTSELIIWHTHPCERAFCHSVSVALSFRLLVRLLTQVERVVAIDGLEQLSADVVETGCENLVIGHT